MSTYKDQKEEISCSLFGDFFNNEDSSLTLKRPEMPNCEEYNKLDLLKLEKDYVGFYISGHPLEKYRELFNKNCTCDSKIINTPIEDIEEDINYEKAIIAGIITDVNIKLTKTNKQYGLITIEDFKGEIKLSLFGTKFAEYKNILRVGEVIVCFGTLTTKYNDPNRLEFKCDKINKVLNV